MMTPETYTQNLKNILRDTIEQAFAEFNTAKLIVLFDKIRHLREMINLQELLEAGLV
jgi:hypothetical protein